MHIFHKWGKWTTRKEIPAQGILLLQGIEVGRIPIIKKYQYRFCLKCGKYQDKEV